MATPPPPSPSPPPLPIPISTSTLLTSLPHTSTSALATASTPPTAKHKILVRFKPVGSAPALSRAVWKIEAGKPFSRVVQCLREQLGRRAGLGAGGGGGGEGEVFAYVNTFAPGLDEEVGMLFECFKVDNHLVVNYCLSAAFG